MGPGDLVGWRRLGDRSSNRRSPQAGATPASGYRDAGGRGLVTARRSISSIGIAGAAWLASTAAAQPPVADPAIVPLFEEACLKGELTLEAREAALASGGWQEVPAGDLRLKLVEPNPLNIDFAKAQSARQWKRDVGGREVRAVVAKLRPKLVYRTGCLLLVPNVKSSWPYWEALGGVLRPLGLKAKETDLPHFRAYGGKLADGRRSRATISSKSGVVPGEEGLMHMFIAY